MASIYSELLYPIEIKYPNFVPENERIKRRRYRQYKDYIIFSFLIPSLSTGAIYQDFCTRSAGRVACAYSSRRSHPASLSARNGDLIRTWMFA